MKKSLYAIAGSVLLAVNQVNAAIGVGGVDDKLKGSTDSADVVIQLWISRVLGFLYLAAVIYGLWGGFNILTAGGNEDKVKTGKTVIINAAIGIVVIFIVGSVVKWILTLVGATGSL